jgi:hypothetical protein
MHQELPPATALCQAGVNARTIGRSRVRIVAPSPKARGEWQRLDGGGVRFAPSARRSRASRVRGSRGDYRGSRRGICAPAATGLCR